MTAGAGSGPAAAVAMPQWKRDWLRLCWKEARFRLGLEPEDFHLPHPEEADHAPATAPAGEER